MSLMIILSARSENQQQDEDDDEDNNIENEYSKSSLICIEWKRHVGYSMFIKSGCKQIIWSNFAVPGSKSRQQMAYSSCCLELYQVARTLQA